MKRTLLALALTAAALPVLAQTDDDRLVARVNGKEITNRDLNAEWSRIAPSVQEQYKQVGGKHVFLDNYISKYLLVQEAVRIHHEPPPALEDGMKRAGRLGRTDPSLPDIVEAARAAGVSLLYVPSMRNGVEREDRGNAILSTLPLDEAYAFELPFRRQRRVGVAATVTVNDAGVPRPLRLVNVHFDTSQGWARLWVLGNPRPAQARATLDYAGAIDTPAPLAIIGGDFNTFLPFEDAAEDTRRGWAKNQGDEDASRTRGLVRLDYLFFRLEAELCGGTRRADGTFGSDHYPVIGRFRRTSGAVCGS